MRVTIKQISGSVVVLGLVVVAMLATRNGGRGVAQPGFLIGIARPPWDTASLTIVRDSGANSFRRTLEWRDVRGPDGVLRIPSEFQNGIAEGRRLGLEPVVVLSYGNAAFDGGGYPRSETALAAFEDFARFSVARLKDRVKYWELWNEWNRGTGMPAWAGRGDAASYAVFANRVSPVLRKADETLQIWGGSMEGIGRMNDWTRQACAAGMLGTLDALTFHPYCNFLPTDDRLPERGLMGFVKELTETIRPFERGTSIPLFLTELGWPTHEGEDGVSLEEQAKFTARALFLLRAEPRIKGVWIYTLYDRAGAVSDRENHFGLLWPDGTPKPAWFTFSDAAHLLRDAKECVRLRFDDIDSESLAGVTIMDGYDRRRLAVWAIEPGEVWKVVLRWPQGGFGEPRISARTIGAGNSAALTISKKKDEELCEITVTDLPLILDGVPVGTTVEYAELQ